MLLTVLVGLPLARLALLAFALAALLGLTGEAAAQGVASAAHAPFPNFESAPVRPLLLSPDGTRLYWLNTPDHRVEIVDTGVEGGQDLVSLGSVFTGLQPVSMALHPDDANRLFVVNELSDDVAVVDLERRQVIARIPVGDAPADVVVHAGRMFVSTARSAVGGGSGGGGASGPGVPGPFAQDALVAAQIEPPYAVLGRRELPGHRPRSLAVADGLVWVAALHSGNRTTTLSEEGAKTLGVTQFDLTFLDEPFAANPALLLDAWLQSPFADNPYGQPGWAVPVTGRILLDSELPGLLPSLADADVIAVNPMSLAVVPERTAHGVGTTLLALGARPDADELWVAGTDARNRTRFEPVLKGRAVQNRLSVVGADGALRDVLALAPPLTAREHAQPAALAFDVHAKGTTVYVAALGSATVLALDADSGAVLEELAVPALPTGLAVDPERRRLYVFSRGTRELSVYALEPGLPPLERRPAPGVDPEPAAVRRGRIHLYEARPDAGHGNGNMSCATCHVSGHLDQLAWDLGDPEGALAYVHPELLAGEFGYDGYVAVDPTVSMVHPMKGPMTTQSLRGLMDADGPPLHWRGDRHAFQTFRGAFRSLLGGGGITPGDMQALTAFVRELAWPPNPYQPRDRGYQGEAAAGFVIYGLDPQLPGFEYDSTKVGATCQSCHSADLAGLTDVTGSDRRVLFDGNTQVFNPAGFRGAYEREFRHKTGFGLVHDGSVDDIRDFMEDGINDGVPPPFPTFNGQQKNQVTALLRAWDSGLSPLVGAQFVADDGNVAALDAFLELARHQALDSVGWVDLVARAHLTGAGAPPEPVGLLWAKHPDTHTWQWRADLDVWVGHELVEVAVRFGLVELALTVVPRGQGLRLGIDRDEDGLLDGVERGLGSDPADPDSDDDGHDDALEVLHGSDPLVAAARLPGDVSGPGVLVAELRDVFTTTATLHVLLDEPGTLEVDVSPAPGQPALASFAAPELRRRHDLVLAGLPAGTLLHTRLRTADANGNARLATGSFTTLPPELHVAALTLQKQLLGGVTLHATVTVADQDGVPVADVPVRGIWVGDIGGAEWFPEARTDADGRATFSVGPYAPGPTSVVSFSPAYIGSPDPDDPWFVGVAGDTPAFFYDATANAASYRQVLVP